MIEKPLPADTYRQQLTTLEAQLQEAKRRKERISWMRLGVIIFTALVSYQLWIQNISLAFVAALIGIAIFLRLVVLAGRNREAIDQLNSLVHINREELKVLDHQYTQLPDGIQFKPADHAYANDLDIFGRASLYQYINRASTEKGQQTLAQWLLSPAEAGTILERQEAVKELSDKVEWRQTLQAYGQQQPLTSSMQSDIEEWLKEPALLGPKSAWQWLRYVLPAIILGILVLNLAGFVTNALLYLFIFIFLVISGLISLKIFPYYKKINKLGPQLSTMARSLAWIEKASFQSELLKRLQQSYVFKTGIASRSIRRLQQLLNRFDVRLNPLVFIPLNIFLLWDLQQALNLEKWKAEQEENIARWFQALGEIEALGSLANLSFNQPHWSFPAIAQEHGTFMAKGLGHPLIAASKNIRSDYATIGAGQISLITGSNMAGKSTFLRSVGVNIVLAMMGSPVCAAQLGVSVMQVMSSMRIADNLEESTSTFYAELKKLQGIIQAVNQKEKVFLLLDEILRGTNSLDRHTGSQALLIQLIKQDAVGMLATHDLALASISETYPGNLHNYHFDVQVAGDELYFDYKLKDGVCQSMNASILMQKIGIKLN